MFLCAEDWVSQDLKSCPWHQGMIAAGPKVFGTWRIRAKRAGVYRVEVRRWPREIDAPLAGVPAPRTGRPDAWLEGKPVDNLLYGGTPQALPVARIGLTISGRSQECAVKSTDGAAIFEVDLPPGEHTVDARLIDASGQDIAGAYYVYIRPAAKSERTLSK